jgi:hypothetical protein
LFSVRELLALHPVGKAVEQRFKAWRQRGAAGGGLELFGQRADFLLQRRHVGSADAGGAGHAFDFRRQAAHLVGQHGELIVRGDMRDDAAQGRDRAFELLQETGILACPTHLFDLVRQVADRVLETGEALGGFEFAQRIANLDEAALHPANQPPGRSRTGGSRRCARRSCASPARVRRSRASASLH